VLADALSAAAAAVGLILFHTQKDREQVKMAMDVLGEAGQV
jgi:hypothetical protein